MRDQTYINHIEKSQFLNENTKRMYISKLHVIQHDIWKNCKGIKDLQVGKGKCLDYIIKHPEVFLDRLDEYTEKTKGRLEDSSSLSIHAKNSYITAILAVFRHTPSMMQKHADLFKKWQKIQNDIRKPINDKYMTNKPDERQEKAFVPLSEIVKKRNSLPKGTQTRLLLAMYTMIPPARSDYNHVKIFKDISKMTELELDEYEGNYIILSNQKYMKNKIVLKKYKTSKMYGDMTIEIPPELAREIKASLKKEPREYLFIGSKTKEPYENANSFNKWANRELKRLFDNKYISLTTLRHIYISEQKLDGKTRAERDKVAKKMMHSVDTQDKYRWIKHKKTAPPITTIIDGKECECECP